MAKKKTATKKPVESRSMQRRKAAMRGEPRPEFTASPVPPPFDKMIASDKAAEVIVNTDWSKESLRIIVDSEWKELQAQVAATEAKTEQNDGLIHRLMVNVDHIDSADGDERIAVSELLAHQGGMDAQLERLEARVTELQAVVGQQATLIGHLERDRADLQLTIISVGAALDKLRVTDREHDAHFAEMKKFDRYIHDAVTRHEEQYHPVTVQPLPSDQLPRIVEAIQAAGFTVTSAPEEMDWNGVPDSVRDLHEARDDNDRKTDPDV